MTYTEAAKILEQEKNKFLDEWIDYGGVAEAYNTAINLLENQEKTKLDIAHEIVSGSILMYQGKELVLCKNCKHQKEYKTGSCPYYTTYGIIAPDSWFCADGVRKN